MKELGDYVPVNVAPPHPMCGHCLPDISSHRGCYPHTISQYHWWYIDLMIYQRLYNTYEYSTQYHNLYNDISYGHHIMVYTTISTLLLRSWTISHFPENLNVLPHTTKEGLRYISHIVYISHLIRYLIHWMQWKLQLFCYFGPNLLVARTNDIICLMWALMTGAIVLIRRPPPRKCFSIKNDKSPVSLVAIKC